MNWKLMIFQIAKVKFTFIFLQILWLKINIQQSINNFNLKEKEKDFFLFDYIFLNTD